MSIIVALNHVTEYLYEKQIKLFPQIVRLKPCAHARASIQSYSLKVEPKGHFINWQQDPFNNYLARLSFPEKTNKFRIEVDLVTEIKVFNPFDFFLDDSAKYYPFNYDSELKEELFPYFEIKENGNLLSSFYNNYTKKAQNINDDKVSLIDFLVNINKDLYDYLKYIIRLEPGIQTCEETLEKASGSCRDMAWLLCQILRHLGLATRFVSGYLIQLKSDVISLDGPSGTEEDFADLHAWTEVYIPGAGWIGLDPTSGLLAGEGHIPLSCTPNPSSSAPVTGNIESCQSVMNHTIIVTRIYEDKKVTKPFTKQEWDEVDQLGYFIDKQLNKDDVRLTMGSEPTFVSLDDPVSEQWNYGALGDDKKQLGIELLNRLKNKYAAHGLTMFTQGKWYPGEILPRWAYQCFYRKDGHDIWTETALLSSPIDTNKKEISSLDVLQKISDLLAVSNKYILPAYEDTIYYLWQSKDLNKDMFLSESLEDSDFFEQRERLKILDLMNQKITKLRGHVLPLHYSHINKVWISNDWGLQNKKIILSPGDSPLGLRLPLSKLSNNTLNPEDIAVPDSLYAEQNDLPTKEELIDKIQSYNINKQETLSEGPIAQIKTALCVENRDNNIYIFMPPLQTIEQFLELVTVIEHVAAKLEIKVILEGYTPPHDLRVTSFSVTPDPGVLEVNVQPSGNWDELKDITETIYEEARQSRLTTEKFMLDGRRVGTGGGNHIIVGAAKPEDSPILRNPNLLRSMVTFWQNHPSLSYLFSSQYIGPTSQSPRIDEARHDSLYELEIAFQQIPDIDDVPYWVVDRLFRNILVDLTGNTHRAEFCIDKLYSPEFDARRLGLLEMRGFEMPPHPQLNLLQSLLIRGLVSSFWRKPYKNKLIPWGTLLHDKYMLPHYIWEDFQDVISYLKHNGYDFKLSWFESFMNFRFPMYGKHTIGNVNLQLRMALEPWLVMGEELHNGSVSRGVDSSVERLEVKVSGLIPERNIVTCNNRYIPLTPTNEKDTYVAGIKYKAWSPYSCLHPTIHPHTPLVFDIIDTYYVRSLGGCTYHIMHPGGRNYDAPPVNENEAYGRCLSRFDKFGHTPGKCTIPPKEYNDYFPYTLDLRQQRNK